jgi:mannose/fructose/N-acetylgalactosamine-specific phosphotransferase system component IIC
MLLGLTWAVTLAHIGSTWLTVAAWLIVASSAFQVGSAVLAWVQGTVDEFKERSPSFYLATTNAILVSVGVAILLYGVLVSL